MSERNRAEAFRALHVRGRPFVLFNIWDVGSAGAVEEAGAAALATGSWAVAAAHGFADGEKVAILAAMRALREAAAHALEVAP